ncbi:MAG: LCP family protein [Solobacterium sp.]|nr:LCP family protein [Solobacterium sp.]
MTAKRKTRKKRYVNAQFLWFLLLISAGLFFWCFYTMPMFPKRWSWFLLAALISVVMLSGIFTSIASHRNWFIRLLNAGLSLMLIIGSIYLPVYKNKVSDLFNSVLGDKVKINLYAMQSSPDNLEEYKDSVFITTYALDSENQDYALSKIREDLETEIQSIDRPTVYDSVGALYRNEGQILIMAEAYESVIEETEGYENFREDTKIIATYYRTINTNIKKSDASLTNKPFTIFFGGNDQEGELSLIGRTDVNMLVTVNPNTHQISIVSVPRDSYIPNPALGYGNDKLTHLGINGIENTMSGLSNYFGIPVDHYVLINFTTYKKIIDALGGIDVYNPYAFRYTWDKNYYFEEGNIHLDGQAALYYVRERYTLPDGDFGRNMHQQIVMSAILDKVTSPEVITKFDKLLSAMKGTFVTDLSDSAIYGICEKQLDEQVKWNTVRYGVLGTTGGAICAAAPGQKLSVVFPYENQVDFVSSVMDNVINGNIMEQQEIPEGVHY